MPDELDKSVYDRALWNIIEIPIALSMYQAGLSAKTHTDVIEPHETIFSSLHAEIIKATIEAGEWMPSLFDGNKAALKLIREVTEMPTAPKQPGHVADNIKLIADYYKNQESLKAHRNALRLPYAEREIYLERTNEKLAALGVEKPTSFAQIAPNVRGKARRTLKEGETDFIKTGFFNLDNWNLFRQGEACLVYGDGKVGKTALVSQLVMWMLNQMYLSGKPKGIVIFSLELSPEDFYDRLAVARSMFPYTNISNHGIVLDDTYEMDLQRYEQAVDDLHKLPIYICKEARPTIKDIKYHMKRAKDRFGEIGLVALDYLGLMGVSGEGSAKELQGRTQLMGDFQVLMANWTNDTVGHSRPSYILVGEQNRSAGGEGLSFTATTHQIMLGGNYEMGSFLSPRNPNDENTWSQNRRATNYIKAVHEKEPWFLGMYAPGTPHQITIEECLISIPKARRGRGPGVRGFAFAAEIASWVHLSQLKDPETGEWLPIEMAGQYWDMVEVGEYERWYS